MITGAQGQAQYEGEQAYQAGIPQEANPYSSPDLRAYFWRLGWVNGWARDFRRNATEKGKR